MREITALLGELRGEEPPGRAFDHHKVLEERRRALAAESPALTAAETVRAQAEPACEPAAKPVPGPASDPEPEAGAKGSAAS